MTRWDPRVAHFHDGPPSDPDRYRRQAQEALNGRRHPASDLQEDPRRAPRTVAEPRPRRAPVELVEFDHEYLLDGPVDLVIVLPGQVPLANRVGERGTYNADTRKVYNPATKVRGEYADRVAQLCRTFAPRRRDHDVEWDLIVHHLVDSVRVRGNPPDAGGVRIAVKGALDGLTESHNPDAWVLRHDRNVHEIMTVAVPAVDDVLVLTLRASVGWPLPVVTIPGDHRRP